MGLVVLSDVTEVASPEEVAAGRLDDDKIERLAGYMRVHGCALLAGGVVPTRVLEQLAPRFEFDTAYRYLDALKKSGGGDTTVPCLGGSKIPGHGSARLPRAAPWVFPEIVANPLIEQVVAATLGPRPYLNVYGGNLNFPGSGTQELHMDGVWHYSSQEAASAAGVGWPPPPHQVIAQICPTGSTILSGATEVWPGSHLVTELASVNKFVDGSSTRDRYAAAGKARASQHPPMRLEIPVGAVAFRDNRLFHRGVPNTGHSPRPMLGLQYASRAVRDDLFANSTKLRSRLPPDQVPTDNNGNKISPEDRHVIFEDSDACRSAFATPSLFGVDRNVAFIPGPLDYDGNPGELPMELPPIARGIELPKWLRDYIDRQQTGTRGAAL
jgi:hypothetical protein